jgi:feruloyl-CoA synthase
MSMFGPTAVDMRTLPDGSILLTNAAPLPAYESRLLDRLDHWALRRPKQTFLAERRGEGWRTLSYLEARCEVQALAARRTHDTAIR